MTLFSRRTAAAVLISAAALPSASSFQATSVLPLRARSGDAACTAASMSVDTPRSNLGRRDVLGAALGGAVVLLGAVPALAKDVGDGGLPEGMLLLQQILLFQKQWKDIGKRVESGKGELEKKEWENIQGFLRKFYEGGDDMVKISKGFTRPEQEEVKELAKTFRKAVKAIDKPAAAQDADGFLASHKEIQGYLATFMDIRAGKSKAAPPSDVPDEL